MIEKVISKESFFIKNFEGNTKILDKHVAHILEFDRGRKITNEGGYQSNDITFGFEELLLSINQGFKEIDQNTVLGNFWLNINKGTDYNRPHIHGFTGWSVVYYHKICCDQSPIVFSSLVPCIQKNCFSFVPKSQQIIFFNSWYPHSVQSCNQVNHERVSLAFNYLFTK